MGKWPRLDGSCVRETKDSSNVYERSKVAPVVILHGQSGMGKRWAAKIVFRKYHDASKDQPFYALTCKAASHDFVTTGPSSDFGTQNLEEIFENIRQCQGDKFIVLDATNLETVSVPYLLQFLDEFCQNLEKEQSEMGEEQSKSGEEQKKRSKWTILVPVTHSTTIQPRQCPAIGEENFIKFNGFQREEIKRMISLVNSDFKDDDAEYYAERISKSIDVSLPTAIKLVVKKLRQVKAYTEWEDFWHSCVLGLGNQSCGKEALDKPSRDAVELIHKNIENCLKSESDRSDIDTKLMVKLSQVDNSSVPQQLVMALAEGVGSQHGDRVSLNVPPIMDKLVSGGILEFYEKGPLKYYKFHNLFKEGMGTYAQKLGDPSCLELLVHTAIAVICRMPKDGQMHDSYYILTCLRQADTVDGVVEQRLTKLDENSPLFNEFRSILILLRCELHRCMAQCQHALGFGKEAISMLNKSLDFHNEASGSELDYTPLEHGEHTDPASALKLYQLQQKDSFRLPRGKGCDFLEQLVKFHVFTLTSKVHSTYLTNNDYVNDHLTEQAYDRMRKEGRLVFCKDKVSSRKVLDCEKLAKVLMGERLAAIYCLYAEVCRQMKEANPSEDLPDEKELAWISYKICERVRQDNRGPLQDIFLLQTVISYRTYLGIKLEEAGASDITDLYKRFEELELKTFPEAASLEPNLDRGIPAPVHAPNPASLMPPQAAGLSPATTDVNAATSPSFVVTTAQTNTPGDRSTVSRPAQQTAGTSSSTNGPLPQPTFLMEKGIVKYNLNTDTYFKVSALQSKLLAKAKLHQLREEDNIESGSQIIAEIMSIIDSKYKDFNVRGFIRKNRSLNPQCAHHQELSRAHRISGQFHRDCGNFEEAIRSAILALHHQKEAAGGKLLFEHLTFRRLLVKLKRYAETIKEPFLSDRDREARLLDDLTAPSVCGDDSTQESKQHLVDLQQIQTWAVKASLKPEEATDSPN